MRIPFASRSKPQPPPVDLMMTNFSKHKKIDDYWESPIFLSHPKGYEMCLRVRANGYTEGKGTHVSLFLHLVKGSHDESLHWPFNGTVKVRLCSENEKDDIEFVFKMDDSVDPDSRKRVVTGLQSRGGLASSVPLVCPCFVPHDKLKDSGYLDDDDTLRFRVTEITVTDTQVESSISSSQHSQVSQFIIKEFAIQNFSKYKKAFGPAKDWTSPPFYSHDNGYKFLLVVSPNGRRKSEGRSVSAYVHLMKGEYDSKLKFPFRGTITVELVNCITDSDHHRHVVKFDNDTDRSGKYGERVRYYKHAYNGLGITDFISHKDLEYNSKRNTKYLSLDCLQFRIVKIETF